MRQSRAAKAETHQTIVTEAARLFRARGIERTSVADVMQAAEKTHGGFYRHFATKEALLESALDAAFAHMIGTMTAGFARTAPADALHAFARYYLGEAHVANSGEGCPVAALASEVARAGEGLRQAFGAGTHGVIDRIAQALAGSATPPPADSTEWQRAAQGFAMAAGALMMARASDPATAARVLDAARTALAAI